MHCSIQKLIEDQNIYASLAAKSEDDPIDRESYVRMVAVIQQDIFDELDNIKNGKHPAHA